ncbi:carbohydrate esterase family 8 protein [Mollisia scopiformis]|uniref:Pectinesterase n=1 Tax=Mollisia scopiformis TaxID=149040 RepID=A0A194XDC5_MOLSC|nr:carbohydrate esterase family 8 protein [Mollisia scopiformis]KUJ18180.1 carbohydrate esterase family 8 protein [Mollisia scopiformis]
MHLFFYISAFATAVLATSRTTAPSGAITVGSGGTYSTIQDAIDSLSTTSTTAQSLFILAGTYTEQVTIPSRAAALTIYGYTTNTASYTSNVVNIEHSSSLASGASSDEATGTVINEAANTKFYNINIKNTYGEGSQAIALAAYNTEQGYYGVGLYGYQDTLLAETGNQVYAACYIEGAVDFIFGQHAIAWIDSSDIRVSAGGGAITANGRSSSSDVSYYVINKSSVDTTTSSTATSGTVFLGRPWSEYARVCFQDTVLSNIINSAGWEEWSSSEPNTEDVTFEEYGNTGDGASGTRASFSTKLSSALSISTILGSGYADWVDTSYLA